MFKRDNEQEDRYSQGHQPTHKMRGGINQYGQQHQYHPQYKNDGVHGQRDDFDAASARIRQFQQQQERMRQMQNSGKPQYQKSVPSPLSSIPEVNPTSSVVTTSNLQSISPNNPIKPSVNIASANSFDRLKNPIIQTGGDRQHDIGNDNEDASPTLSNVMEGLINVAESVVASKSCASPENSGIQDLIPNEPLRNDPSK